MSEGERLNRLVAALRPFVRMGRALQQSNEDIETPILSVGNARLSIEDFEQAVREYRACSRVKSGAQ